VNREPKHPLDHPFLEYPHGTLLALTFPVLLSLIAEPVTGLVDTAFVARLGSVPLAALGVGAIALSSVFWIFNFLGIGSQTEVAQAMGRQNPERAAGIAALAFLLSGFFGAVLALSGFFSSGSIASAMGASGEMRELAVEYLKIRWLGAPAVLATLTAFGVLRGLQDMKTPLWVAAAVNLLNIGLDAGLIFGLGPFPELGIAGAALASTISQWLGAVWAVLAVFRKVGMPERLRVRGVWLLMRIGGDLFVRTGLLTLFLLLATRTATRIGAETGAAHQAIRQVWIFTALFLDAFALTGQSLVGYFLGARSLEQARRVARVVCIWSLGCGVALGMGMWVGRDLLAELLVPAPAMVVFFPAWNVAALFQPLNALSFATDGIHWGTGDFRFLRNAVMAATSVGIGGLFLLNVEDPGALTWVWVVTGVWIFIRASFGICRIWPGLGNSPLWQDAPVHQGR
jgi:MATE family multidrug resistance protein